MALFDEVLDNVGKPYTNNNGFERGTHEVLIMLAEAKQKKTKKNDAAEVIEVTVADEKDNDKTAICTLWFSSEGGAKMSVTKVLGLLVHKVAEDKKDAVRDLGKRLFGSVDDPIKARDVAAKLINDKLLGAKAYIVAEPSGNYTTTSYADIWHYAAEPQGGAKDEPNNTDKADNIGPADIPSFGEEDL